MCVPVWGGCGEGGEAKIRHRSASIAQLLSTPRLPHNPAQTRRSTGLESSSRDHGRCDRVGVRGNAGEVLLPTAPCDDPRRPLPPARDPPPDTHPARGRGRVWTHAQLRAASPRVRSGWSGSHTHLKNAQSSCGAFSIFAPFPFYVVPPALHQPARAVAGGICTCAREHDWAFHRRSGADTPHQRCDALRRRTPTPPTPPRTRPRRLLPVGLRTLRVGRVCRRPETVSRGGGSCLRRRAATATPRHHSCHRVRGRVCRAGGQTGG